MPSFPSISRLELPPRCRGADFRASLERGACGFALLYRWADGFDALWDWLVCRIRCLAGHISGHDACTRRNSLRRFSQAQMVTTNYRVTRDDTCCRGRRTCTALFALFAMVLVTVLCTAWANAAPACVRANFKVIDDKTLRPIARVHVTIEGDARQWDGFTSAYGTVSFSCLLPDSYGAKFYAKGFIFPGIRVLNLTEGQQISLTIEAHRSGLREIANVATAARQAPSKNWISSGSEIAGSLAQSLPFMPELNQRNGYLSIRNANGQTTTATINGAAIFPSGANIPLDLLTSDIFDNAEIKTDRVLGAPDGSLSLNTYDPTIDWRGMAQERIARFGDTSVSLRERGTTGHVGLAFSHAQSTTANIFNGAFFKDTSGLSYQHNTMITRRADSLTIRAPMNDNVAFLDLGRLSVSRPFACAIIAQQVPCGYGPDVTSSDTVSYVQIRDEVSMERAAFTARLFSSALRSQLDLSRASFFGEPVGIDSISDVKRTGVAADASILMSARRTLNISLGSATDTSRDLPRSNGPLTLSPPQRNTTTKLNVDLPILNAKRWSATGSVGMDVSGGSASWTHGIQSRYLIRSGETAQLFYHTGDLGSIQYSADGVSAPTQLQFDCAGHRALGVGPSSGQLRGAPSSSYGFTWQDMMSALRLTFSTYRTIDRLTQVNAEIPARAMSPSYFSANYLNAASRAAELVCGSHQALGIGSLYFTIATTVPYTVRDGVNLSAQIALGRRAQAQFSYALNRDRAFGPSSLFVVGSDATEGGQIPKMPLQSGNLAIVYRLSPAADLAAAANFQGANNPWRPTPVALFDLGLQLNTARGSIVAALQNMTNIDPAGTASFAPFPRLTVPVAARSFSVRYQLPIGNANIDRAPYLTTPVDASMTAFYLPRPFESAAQPDWLAPAKDVPFCGPEDASRAEPMLRAINDYRMYVESSLRNGDDRSIAPKVSNGLRLQYVRSRVGYTIAIGLPADFRNESAFLRCAKIHDGSFDVAERLGVYIPGWKQREQSRRLLIFFAPQSGLYSAPEAVDETNIAPKPVSRFPDRGDITQMGINFGSCPLTYREAVIPTVAAMKGYIARYYAGDTPASIPDLTVAAHKSKGGMWLEISGADPSFINAVAQCLNVPLATPRQVQRYGFGGAFLPSINYAPAIGFYRVVPDDNM